MLFHSKDIFAKRLNFAFIRALHVLLSAYVTEIVYIEIGIRDLHYKILDKFNLTQNLILSGFCFRWTLQNLEPDINRNKPLGYRIKFHLPLNNINP